MLLALQIAVADHDHLRVALAGLTAMDMALMALQRFPPLYSSGVRYRREQPDRWDTADIVASRGYGDCEDLAAWRAAELRLGGENAIADVYAVGPRKWHAIVVRGDGRIEDPARLLGMGRRRRRR